MQPTVVAGEYRRAMAIPQSSRDDTLFHNTTNHVENCPQRSMDLHHHGRSAQAPLKWDGLNREAVFAMCSSRRKVSLLVYHETDIQAFQEKDLLIPAENIVVWLFQCVYALPDLEGDVVGCMQSPLSVPHSVSRGVTVCSMPQCLNIAIILGSTREEL